MFPCFWAVISSYSLAPPFIFPAVQWGHCIDTASKSSVRVSEGDGIQVLSPGLAAVINTGTVTIIIIPSLVVILSFAVANLELNQPTGRKGFALFGFLQFYA